MSTGAAKIQTEVPPGRVERRRLDTRMRILEAAERLMRSRPVDKVTIQDITEAADVGHGSFYLHFKSKYDVLVPIIQGLASHMDKRLRVVLKDVDDAAEIIAVSARHVGRMIVADEMWRWVLQHSGVPIEELRQAVGAFVERDFKKGLASGRFEVNDPSSVAAYTLGGYFNCVIGAMGHEDAHLKIDEGVELTLRVFGLAPEDARHLAHQPLPQLAQSDARG